MKRFKIPLVPFRHHLFTHKSRPICSTRTLSATGVEASCLLHHSCDFNNNGSSTPLVQYLFPRYHSTHDQSRFRAQHSDDNSEDIRISSTLVPIQQLEKTTQRLVAAGLGTLDQASIFELTTAISSWHAESIENPYNEHNFEQAAGLLYRLVEEFEHSMASGSHGSVEITVAAINRVLDACRIISNAIVPPKIERSSKKVHTMISSSSSSSTSPSSASLVHRGLELLRKISKTSQQYNDDRFQHPNDKSYNIIMDAFAKHGMTEESQAVFDEMVQVSSQHNQPQCRPDTVAYNTLLAAYANTHSNTGIKSATRVSNAQKAQEILQDMLMLYQDTGNNPDIKPDVISFSTVISACANASSVDPSFAQDAEDILDQMKKMYESSTIENGGDGEWLGLRPNHICYSTAIDAWGKSGVPSAAEKASSLFADLQCLQHGNAKNQGDGIVESMTAMFGAYGSDGTDEAEALLDRMIERANETGDTAYMPEPITFTAFINCLAESAAQKYDGDNGEAALKAEAIVNRMQTMYEGGNHRVKPNTITYNALIKVWSKSKRIDAGQRAEEWLHKMELMFAAGDETVKPDSITFSSVIHAYAGCKDGKGAERILMKVIEDGKSADSFCQPDPIIFTSAIDAYAKSGQPEEAERLLGLMKELHMEPDVFSYNGLLNAYVKSKKKGSINRCLEILQEMEDVGIADCVAYTAVIESLSVVQQSWAEKKGKELLDRMWKQYNGGNEEAKPTSVTYNSIINLLAKSRRSSVRAEAVSFLEELETKYEESKDPSLRPNTVTFNACLNSFSKATCADEAMRAETILSKMQEMSDSGVLTVQPDSYSMTNVISAWANSNAEGSAERAEAVLNTMQNMYESGVSSMKPTTVAFGAVLHAWAKFGDAARAEAIVDHMEQLMDKEGFEEMVPNTIVYNTLINAWARSQRREGILKAEAILAKMNKLKQQGRAIAAPSRVTYNSILSAYQKNRGDMYEKARELLREMEEQKQSDPAVAPDVVTYTTFLNILAGSNARNKTKIVQNILSAMERDLDNPAMRPNNYSYDAVLRICARLSSRDQKVKRHALILALETLTKVQESQYMKPTAFTYSMFFSAIANLSSGQEYSNLLTRTVRDCCDAGLLEDKTLANLSRKAPHHLIEQILDTDIPLKQLRVKDLPPGWSSNASYKPSARSQRVTERAVHNTGRRHIRRS